MEKASEVPTLDLKDISKPIIELSKNLPLKKPSLSILSFLKCLSCTSSRSTVIQTQSLGDAIAQATLELKEQVQTEVEENEKTVEKAVLAVVEQAQVLKQAQMKEAEAQEKEQEQEALNQLDIMKAQSKEDIMDPTTIEILINVTDGLRVVTEKQKKENEKMDEPAE